MEIKRIEYDFSVCKVADYSCVNLDAEYCFAGKTDEEKSLVCITEDVPLNVIERDDGGNHIYSFVALRMSKAVFLL